MECNYCKNTCIKKGKRGNVQKYFCKTCRKYQQSTYRYRKYTPADLNYIKKLSNDAAGTSAISRIAEIPKTTVQRLLFNIGSKIKRPIYKETKQQYEIDEMAITVVNEEDIYLIYAINRKTKKVIDFFIGKRTKENLRTVVNAVLNLYPATIYTDGLNTYPSLIPKPIHKVGKRFTNRIERNNLTLRTHIKRLVRKTLCLTRKVEMLEAAMKIYCWAA